VGRLLVVDTSTARVVECDTNGTVTWSAPPALGLREPRTAVAGARSDSCLLVDDALNWVAEVHLNDDRLLWSYGTRGAGGREPERLYSPKDAAPTAAGVVIADSYNNRLIEVSPTGRLSWSYGLPAEAGSAPGRLWRPTCCRPTRRGTFLVADSKNHRVIEVRRDGAITRSVGEPQVERCSLRLPRSVVPVAGGEILIANTHADELVWYSPTTGGEPRRWRGDSRTGDLYWPRSAVQVGAALWVCDGRHDRLLRLGPGPAARRVVAAESATGELRDPHQVTPSIHQGLLVTSTANDRLYCLPPRAHNLHDLSLDSSLNDPHSVTETREGTLVVCDTGNARLLLRSHQGHLLEIRALTRVEGPPVLLGRPRFAVELSRGILLVLDTFHRALFAITLAGRLLWSLAGHDDLVVPAGVPFYRDGPCFTYEARWVTPIGSNRLLIGDTGNNRVLALKLDQSLADTPP
jgi:sugar lactone lactonase YvrE